MDHDFDYQWAENNYNVVNWSSYGYAPKQSLSSYDGKIASGDDWIDTWEYIQKLGGKN